MSQIGIQSSAQFQSVIDELEAKRVEFVNKANALDAEHITSPASGRATPAPPCATTGSRSARTSRP